MLKNIRLSTRLTKAAVLKKNDNFNINCNGGGGEWGGMIWEKYGFTVHNSMGSIALRTKKNKSLYK